MEIENSSAHRTPSSEGGIWIWIVLAGLLVLSAAVAFGSLQLLHFNQQGEVPTGSQTAPAR
jgi:hypothetical protein